MAAITQSPNRGVRRLRSNIVHTLAPACSPRSSSNNDARATRFAPKTHWRPSTILELRAVYMPDAAWVVSGHPPSLSRKMGQPPVLTSSTQKLTQATGLRLTLYPRSLRRLASLVATRALSRPTRKSGRRSWWNVPFLSMW
jgi:hypothetical protein